MAEGTNQGNGTGFFGTKHYVGATYNGFRWDITMYIAKSNGITYNSANGIGASYNTTT